MKIAITHEFPFEKKYYGGGNQIVEGLSNSLAKKGHEIHIFTTGKGEFIHIAETNSVKVHFLFPYVKNLSGLYLAILTIFQIINLKPDMVICFTSESAILSLFGKIFNYNILVYQAAPEHPVFTFSKFIENRKKIGIYFQFVGARNSNKILSISESSSLNMINNWAVNPLKISTVGVGLNSIFTEDISESKEISSDKIRLISVGRIVFDQKPFDIIPLILKELNEKIESWTVIGDGPDLDELKDLVLKYGLDNKVFFLGALDSYEIKSHLKKADIAVLPTNFESFFLTAYECAAMSLVVITCDVADLKSYFASTKSVLISPVGDECNFKENLKFAINNINVLSKYAFSDSDRVKRDFNWDRISLNFLK